MKFIDCTAIEIGSEPVPPSQFDIQALVKGIHAHALANYETGGWDMIYECFGEEEIRETFETNGIENPTLEQAIKVIGPIAKIWDDRRKDIQAEAF